MGPMGHAVMPALALHCHGTAPARNRAYLAISMATARSMVALTLAASAAS